MTTELMSMQHLNGDVVCVIDTETTGLDPLIHEMVQICILPLDHQLKPVKSVMPFYIEVKPEHPERAQKEALAVNKLDLATIVNRGHDRMKAIDMLVDWIDKLGLPYTKYGNRKKIMPLGQNYQFDKGFIQAWLGCEQYNELFHYHYRDTMITAQYLNDRAAFRVEPIPFPKSSLGSLASKLGVQIDNAHDALQDCLATAEVYRKLMTFMPTGII